MTKTFRGLFICFSTALCMILLPITAMAQFDDPDEDGDEGDAGTGISTASPYADEDEENADEGADEDLLGDEDADEDEDESIFDEIEEKSEPEVVETNDGPKALQGTWTKHFWFATDDGAFKFQPRGWIQPKFTLAINPDGDENGENKLMGSGFALHRARFGFQAYMFDIVHLYLDTGWSKGSASLVDYFVGIDPFKGLAVLRVGQFRPWFCRQLLMGTTTLGMVDYAKAWTDQALGLNLGRDLGASVHGMIINGIEYGIGIWNGDKSFTTEGNIDYAFGGRIVAHPLALAGIGNAVLAGDESDSAISQKPGLAVGGSVLYNKRHDQIVTISDIDQPYYDGQLKIGAEVGFKFKGLSVTSEFFLINTKVQDDAAQQIKDAVEFEGYDGTGMSTYLQAGYFILPGQLEATARFDWVDEDKDSDGFRMFPAVGASYYIFGNNLKAQFMYRINVMRNYDGPNESEANPITHDMFLMLQAAI